MYQYRYIQNIPKFRLLADSIVSMNSDFDDAYFEARVADSRNRRVMHELDRTSLISYLRKHPIKSALDIGCADGGFILPLAAKLSIPNLYGIEPNLSQAEIALRSGITLFEDLGHIPMNDIELVICRGTLHHLPDWEAFMVAISRMSKGSFLALLANPNSESLLFRKFGRLPALENSNEFSSIFRVLGAKNFARSLEQQGWTTKIAYPYFKTPYSKPIRDFRSTFLSLAKKNYSDSPFPRNMFNLFAVKN